MKDSRILLAAATVATMAIEHEDIMELKRVFDDRYVLQHDCNDTQERINKKLANDDKRIEVMLNDFKVIKWLITTVAATGIGTLVAAILQLVLK